MDLRIGIVRPCTWHVHNLTTILVALYWFGTKGQDFFPNASKLLIAKFVFAIPITCLNSKARSANVAKWQTQQT
jgi:hypothetical protein